MSVLEPALLALICLLVITSMTGQSSDKSHADMHAYCQDQAPLAAQCNISIPAHPSSCGWCSLKQLTSASCILMTAKGDAVRESWSRTGLAIKYSVLCATQSLTAQLLCGGRFSVLIQMDCLSTGFHCSRTTCNPGPCLFCPGARASLVGASSSFCTYCSLSPNPPPPPPPPPRRARLVEKHTLGDAS